MTFSLVYWSLILMKLIPLLSLRTLRTAPLDLKFIHKSMKLFSQSSNSKGKIVKKKFNSFPFQYQEEVIVKITNITNLGSGVGRKELSDGSQWVIHVPYTIPNEEVKCRVFRNHASYSEADLVEVLQPSPTRVEPVCKFYSQCGGCQYQHISVTAQRLWKQEQVQQLLRRLGSFDVTEEGTASSDGAICVNKVIGTDDVFGYRAKLTPHYDTPRGDAEDLRIGFLKASSRYIIDIDECIIALPEINVEYTKLRTKVRQEVRSKLIEREDPIAASKLKKLQGATLLLRQTDDGIATDPKSIIQQTVRGVKFRFVAGEFFQNNLFVLPLMVEHVLRHATSHGCTQLIDTYCGSGLFALCAASSFDNVWGVEVSAKAIDAANKNAILNNVTNAQFLCGVSEDIFGLVSVKIPPEKRGETAVIIDPPRAGCDEAFLRQLFDFNPKTLVYVSCDPATQARDAKIIAANGYSVIDVTPFDLFPQTRHIENVMVFLRP